jgi:hypothetical protein
MKIFRDHFSRAFESGRLQNQPPANPVDIDKLNDFGKIRERYTLVNFNINGLVISQLTTIYNYIFSVAYSCYSLESTPNTGLLGFATGARRGEFCNRV